MICFIHDIIFDNYCLLFHYNVGPNRNVLTHWGLVMQIYIIEPGHQCVREWLVGVSPLPEQNLTCYQLDF